MNRVENRALSPLPSPDVIIEVSPHDATVLVGPCHRRAADWLRATTATRDEWVGEAVAIEGRHLEVVIARAIDAGFTVALRFDAETRLLDDAAGFGTGPTSRRSNLVKSADIEHRIREQLALNLGIRKLARLISLWHGHRAAVNASKPPVTA